MKLRIKGVVLADLCGFYTDKLAMNGAIFPGILQTALKVLTDLATTSALQLPDQVKHVVIK